MKCDENSRLDNRLNATVKFCNQLTDQSADHPTNFDF